MENPKRKSVIFLEGGATSPTVELYRLPSGRCRLWWYCFDQDGRTSRTIATFKSPSWKKAREKGWKIFLEFMQPLRSKTKDGQARVAQAGQTHSPEKRQ